MMGQPRLRIFAGPNGSGKSTLFDVFSQKYNPGFYLNADNIEREISIKGFIDLNDFDLNLTQNDLDEFLLTERAKSLVKKSIENNFPIDFSITSNMISDKKKKTNSYEGALISSFLRHHLQKKKLNYCFETVMSHPNKIDEIIESKNYGYKTYLYFICIDDPEVNISRVKNRVEKGGHDVSPERLKNRFFKTLENLNAALQIVDKCYLFDNSAEELTLIAEMENKQLKIEIEPEALPNWFVKYVLKYY